MIEELLKIKISRNKGFPVYYEVNEGHVKRISLTKRSVLIEHDNNAKNKFKEIYELLIPNRG